MRSLFLLFLLLLPALGNLQSQIIPVKTGNLYSFEFANVYFEVNANIGAHVSSFKVDGTEILATTNDDSYSWGSTLWPSPQSEWTWSQWGNWPPPAALDEGPYTGGIADSAIILTSAVDDGPHLQFRKTFSASLSDTSVTITYTMINTASSAQSFAPWEDSRVPPGGLSFFPLGQGPVTGDAAFAGSFTKMNDDIVWYQYSTANDGKKIFADGRDGWRAHVNGDVLFLKQFGYDLDPADAAPGEGELEEYVATTFHEIENQGAYVSIPAGDSISYTVKWYGRLIPGSIAVEKGNEDLLRFTRRIIGQDTLNTGYGNSALAPGELKIQVYPNPVIDNLTISGTHSCASFRLFDMTGREVLHQSVYPGKEISLGQYPAGLYGFVVTENGKTGTGQLIKLNP